MSSQWTDEEVETLTRNYRAHGPSWDEWGSILPDRTYRAIRLKAHSLGLKCGNPTAFRDYGGAPDSAAEIAVAALDDATRLRLALMLDDAIEEVCR